MKNSRYITIPLFLAIAVVVSFLFAPFLFSALFADMTEPDIEKECGEIVLSWESAKRAESYILYRDGTQVYSGRGRSYVDRPLVVSEFYIYSLIALNDGGISEESQEVLIKTKRPCPPEPPESILVYESPCEGEVSFEWSPSPRAETYQVARSPVPGSTGTVFAWMMEDIVYEGGGTYFRGDGLQAGGLYSYKIRAGNESGWSDWSSKFIRASRVCPPEKPLPPVGS